ncbi:hypothetical protein EUTSA_v10024089mg [Eutrema salsugineum]|uniref:Serpin domain-containing protein n=1 Tax=Eutrema salsugineum TaxID=72664 RepID=V4JUC0_EUTSA|nr:hypothetical protein EUTSA_v10024089mg [Eutrema salsugineum]
MKDLREAIKKKNDAELVLMRESAGSGSDELNAVYSEISNTVLADDSASGGPKIMAINGVWVDQSLPVNHSLKDLFVNVFKATFTQVDFRSKYKQVRIELNKWASDQTNDLIEDLLPHGSVTSKTNESETRKQDFLLLNGSSVSVPFMRSYKRQYVAAYDGFKVLRLPFRQGDGDTNREFSMYLYLPDNKNGLYNVVKKMTSTPGFLKKHIPRDKVQVNSGSQRLDESLYHKACVEIDEEGAEAAVATCFLGFSCLSRSKNIDFVADHPFLLAINSFLFLIREDKTGTVLFAGQIFDPSKSS